MTQAPQSSQAGVGGGAGPIDAVMRLLFGRDVFVSYSHRDGIAYARKLTRDLESVRRPERLTCYFDQRSAILDKRLPPEVVRSLQRSSMLVVVATPGAAESRNVRAEISLFERARRPVVLLLCQPAGQPAEQLRQLVDELRTQSLVVVDEQPGAETSGPSEAALVRIRDSVDFVRQNRRVALSGLVALGAVACLSSFGIWKTQRDRRVLAETKTSALIGGIAVEDRKTTLDLTGWQPTTDAEVAARLKRSKAVSTNHFTIRRTTARVTTFQHIMGTSSGIVPVVHNLSSLKQWVEVRSLDDRTRAPHEWSIMFDISRIPVDETVDIDFSVDFWNAFQTPDQWWGGFRVLHATASSTYTIKFPAAHRPRFETLSYVVKRTSETKYEAANETQVDQDDAGRVAAVTWNKQGPLGDTSYRIKWSWNE
jgi:hypothetical protein